MIKLPHTMLFSNTEISRLGIPEPTREIGITMDMTPTQIADRILVVGGYLAFLEYNIGLVESSRMTLHDSIEHTLTMRMAGMDPKGTIKAKEAEIIASDSALESDIRERVNHANLVERMKGYRNAYRAQYDALSRALSAKQLEADVAR